METRNRRRNERSIPSHAPEPAVDDRTGTESPRGPKPLRLFIGIPLWEALCESATPVEKQIRRIEGPLRWVKPERRHITLKFLGDCPASALPGLEEALSSAVAQRPTFRIVVSGLGGFPRLSKARVLFVGVSEGREDLCALAEAVDRGCLEAGLAGDRKKFQAHITLARSKAGAVGVRVPPEIHRAVWGEAEVGSVSLIESRLSSAGPEYRILREFPLAPGDRRGSSSSRRPASTGDGLRLRRIVSG